MLQTAEATSQIFIIAEVKMRIEQIMQSFDIMAGFNADHQWLRIKKIHPFFGVPVILKKILPYKSIPGIALVVDKVCS